MRATFEKIMALPPERSDNAGRVERIERRLGPADGRTVLDVGSGLAVFPARMKEHGWRVTALDPDPRAAAFARERVGVEAVEGRLHRGRRPRRRFDLVTFNKVLEHVPDPVAMLARRACRWWRTAARVYVELPDGEGAAADPDGPTARSSSSSTCTSSAARRCGCWASVPGSTSSTPSALREPSGKYTIWAIFRPRPG